MHFDQYAINRNPSAINCNKNTKDSVSSTCHGKYSSLMHLNKMKRIKSFHYRSVELKMVKASRSIGVMVVN